MNRKKWLIIAIAVVVLATFLAVIFRDRLRFSDQPNNNSSKLRIGYLPVAAELPLFAALEKGYFKEAGLEVELIRFISSNDMGNAATADRIDILSGCASNVVFDIGNVSGKKHLVFATNPYSNTQGHITDHLIVGKNTGITRLSEIKGRKVASFPGSVNRIFTYLILEKHGIPRDSYSYAEMLPQDWEPALQNGSVEVISALEPNATQIIKDGVGISIFPGFYADLMPNVPLSAHWIAADYYSRADKKQIAAFLTAYERGIKFARENEKEAKTYLVKYANVREDILADVNLNPWQTLSEIDSKQFQTYIDILADNKALQAKVAFSDYLLPDPRH